MAPTSTHFTTSRLKQLLGNVNTRHLVGNNQLPSNLLAARQQNQRFATEVAPGLTYGDVARQAKVDTSLKYGPQEQAIQAQRQGSQDFFKNYVQQIQAAQQAQQQRAQAAADAISKLGQGLDAAAAQNWQGMNQQMQADAANRGTNVSDSLGQVAQNAANVRNALTGSFGAQLYGQGTNDAANLGNRALGAVQQGGEEQTRLGTLLAALKGQEGDFNQQDRQSIVSQAGDAALKNALTNAQIGQTKAQTSNIAADNKRADSSASLASKKYNQATNNTYGMSNGAVAQLRKTSAGKQRLVAAKKAQDKLLHPPKAASTTDKDPYGNTKVQRQSRTSDFRKIYSNAQQIHKVKPKLTWQQIFDAISPDYGSANADVLTGAIQQATLGRVGPSTAKALTGLGVDPGRFTTGKTVKRAAK